MTGKSATLPADARQAFRLPSKGTPIATSALGAGPSPRRPCSACDGADLLVDLARRYLQARRRRDTLFAGEIFADPCWDMLLDLFVSQALGRDVSVSSVCIASCVPQSTALRWLARLEALGLIERNPDPCDGRRTLIRLSETAVRDMAAWLESAFPAPEI